MPKYEAVYTDEQREAMAVAYVDMKLRPASRVVEMAARGALTLNGRELAAFTTNEASVRSFASNLRKRRAGQLASELAKAPPRDAIEALRVRLISVADRELAAIEKTRSGEANLGRLREVIRCVREAAALPGPNEPRPPAPGAKVPGRGDDSRQGAATVGGLAGAILAADRNGEGPHSGGPSGDAVEAG